MAERRVRSKSSENFISSSLVGRLNFPSDPVEAEFFSDDSHYEIPASETFKKIHTEFELRERLISPKYSKALLVSCGNVVLGDWTFDYNEFFLILDQKYLFLTQSYGALPFTGCSSQFYNNFEESRVYLDFWDGVGWDSTTPTKYMMANYNELIPVHFPGPPTTSGRAMNYQVQLGVDGYLDELVQRIMLDYRFPNIVPTADQVLQTTLTRNTQRLYDEKNPITEDRTVGFAHLPGWTATQYGGWFMYIPVNSIILPLPSAQLLSIGCVVIRSRTELAGRLNWVPTFNTRAYICMVMPIVLTEYQNPPQIDTGRYVAAGRELQALLDRVMPTSGGYDQLIACGSLDEPHAPQIVSGGRGNSGLNPLDFMFGGPSQEAMERRNAQIRNWQGNLGQYMYFLGRGVTSTTYNYSESRP